MWQKEDGDGLTVLDLPHSDTRDVTVSGPFSVHNCSYGVSVIYNEVITREINNV